MARLFAFLALLAVCACDQQSPYAPYQQSPYSSYQQYPYAPYQQNSSGWQRNEPQATSPYAGDARQQTPGSPQVQRWSYPDGTVRYGVYDPNTGTMSPDASIVALPGP
jgi:outer membrane lipoprotein-sorting protein